ncbi:MAG TPA: SDR family NAD(P)-dependent oxidoreductase [Candidatus Binatia bacterium]|jgi:NAD(P)-dependent dehydrogenase (short-subunit alcohol dehydrogenase family)|nr:SDR family NAD(P)-dependent oxidoreductase [Candidatus Binatia bacterium]
MARDGRTAVVTGGASGIGRAIALRLARDGADVALFDVNAAGADAVAREIAALGRRAHAVAVDVGSAESVAAGVAAVHAALGTVAILVNDAGIANFVPFLQMTEEQFDGMLRVHLKGTFNCTRALAPDMVEAGWGRIVNVASVAGLMGGPALAHYAAAKAGIIGFTKALAQELGPLGITVNAIAPGMIDTPMLRSAGVPEAIVRHTVERNPIRRLGLPEDVAAVAAYLASEEAGFTTGQVLSPNGGAWV